MEEYEIDEIKLKAVFPPNAPMEPQYNFSQTPNIYETLFFIDFNKQGNCILGSSGVAETFWEGALLSFDNYKQLLNLDYQEYYIYSTASDGKFINDKVIILADDTGHINVLSLEVDSSIRTLNYFRLSNRVPQIGVWENSPNILAAADRALSIWDLNCTDGKPLNKYENYHWDTVLCLDTLKSDTNLFTSGAADRMVCLWDTRSIEAASMLYSNEFSSVTSVAWNQYDDNYLVAGTQAGDIYLLDKREPKDFIEVLYAFSAPVNKILFKNSKDFAVCGDTKEVLVVNSKDNLNIIYKSEEQKGHVKGLAWNDDMLFSCGFGKSISKHSLE